MPSEKPSFSTKSIAPKKKSSLIKSTTKNKTTKKLTSKSKSAKKVKIVKSKIEQINSLGSLSDKVVRRKKRKNKIIPLELKTNEKNDQIINSLPQITDDTNDEDINGDVEMTTIKKTKISKNIHKENIQRQLTDIYADNNGHIPNMKRIKIKKSHPVIKFFFKAIIVGGILAAAAWVGLFFLPNSSKFSEEKVVLKIEGSKQIELAATSTYKIYYENNQNSDLSDVILTIQYPKGFSFIESSKPSTNSGHTEWKIGKLAANKKESIKITGKTYGQTDLTESWRAFLTYKPANYNYKAQKLDTLEVKTNKIPYQLLISGPKETIIGNDITYTFTVNKDKLASSVGMLKLQPVSKNTFSITTSSPKFNTSESWIIDTNTTSTESSEWIFKMTGRFSSSTEKNAEMSAMLTVSLPDNNTEYEIAKRTINTSLEQNTLKLALIVNGSDKQLKVKPGDVLSYSIYLKNSSIEDLNDVTVSLKIDAPSAKGRSVMDWTNMIDKHDGDIIGTQLDSDTRRGEIFWNKKYIPEFNSMIPNDEKTIDVTLPIRDINKLDLDQLKTYTATIEANATYKDSQGNEKKLGSNNVKIILNSDLALEIRDDKKENKELNKDEYKVQWILTNNFHELKDVKITADIYGKVSFKFDDKAPAGKIDYNIEKQQITWNIDKLTLALDTYALPFTIIIDEENETQKTLVSKVNIEATDSVTNEKIKISGDEIKL